MNTSLAKKHDRSKMVMTVAFTVICIIYVLPILIVLMNSFKSNAAVNTETFALPNEDTFVGLQNYIKGMTFGNYPFIKAVFYSLFMTLVSSALILLCTSMAAWCPVWAAWSARSCTTCAYSLWSCRSKW